MPIVMRKISKTWLAENAVLLSFDNLSFNDIKKYVKDNKNQSIACGEHAGELGVEAPEPLPFVISKHLDNPDSFYLTHLTSRSVYYINRPVVEDTSGPVNFWQFIPDAEKTDSPADSKQAESLLFFSREDCLVFQGMYSKKQSSSFFGSLVKSKKPVETVEPVKKFLESKFFTKPKFYLPISTEQLPLFKDEVKKSKFRFTYELVYLNGIYADGKQPAQRSNGSHWLMIVISARLTFNQLSEMLPKTVRSSCDLLEKTSLPESHIWYISIRHLDRFRRECIKNEWNQDEQYTLKSGFGKKCRLIEITFANNLSEAELKLLLPNTYEKRIKDVTDFHIGQSHDDKEMSCSSSSSSSMSYK
ncbi:hypothetical protein B1207_05465 [Legionella quinlivanii]|uniref:Uncharacterized protein n=1 Tax=Legionella quinlivanii TaxID=45073 RepID=A0A364LLK2_9GAMM|nr:hypothetical protein [Legionella quinlivanii]RAP37620.1 hypothetical protein B1207_05465 [Legionella quinlivanii]